MIKQIQIATYEFIDDYIKRLKKEGAKLLSVGTYATVFVHPKQPNVVVKLFEPKFGKNYLDYVEFCRYQVENNPWVPKFYGMNVRSVSDYEGNERPVAFVFMEKLKRATQGDLDKMEATIIANSRLGADSFERYRSNTPNAKFSFSYGWWKVVAMTRKDTDPLLPIAEFLKDAPFLDIHPGNVMMRGKQWVFTDPVAK